jgi:ubiquinone/menaquinone biosynthesis C-methylase UbiE
MMKASSHSNTAQAKKFWTRSQAGKSYDLQFRNLIGQYVDHSESKPLEDLIKGLSGLRVLDIGCGTGRHLSRFPKGNQLHGMDLSAAMLDEACTKNPNHRFVIGSAEKLAYANDSFDLVFSSRVIQHMRDQQKMIREMTRVCKPGGQIILICYNSWSLLNVYKHIRMSWIGKLFNLPFGWILKERSFFGPWGFDYDNYCSIPEVKKMMRQEDLATTKSWGVTSGMPWFYINFFIAAILQRVAPFFWKKILELFLLLDRTIARNFPFKYITDLILVVGVKSKLNSKH